MKKILITIVAAVILLAVVAVIFGTRALNSGVQTGIEKFGPQITNTSLSLESVKLSVLSGSGRLNGVVIGNPEGFKSEKALSFSEAFVDVDVMSLLSDKIRVETVRIEKPEIVFESRLRGNNLKKILANIESSIPTSKESGESGKRLEIGELSIQDATVTMMIAGQGVKVPLPDLTLTDLGVQEEGVTPSEVFSAVMEAVLGQVLGAVAGAAGAVAETGGKAAGAVVDGGSEAVGAVTKKASEALKGAKGLFRKGDK